MPTLDITRTYPGYIPVLAERPGATYQCHRCDLFMHDTAQCTGRDIRRKHGGIPSPGCSEYSRKDKCAVYYVKATCRTTPPP